MKTDFGGYFVELVDPEAPARPVSNVKVSHIKRTSKRHQLVRYLGI
jgi:hypothetical protein